MAILIYQADFLVDEVLPDDGSIVWDLSDLKNATFPPVEANENTRYEVQVVP